ncbi:phage portal protein [Eubacterium barkeri]|uniref:Phage portal protein, SPP1 Gp6-like n=1 Tax=Eubacterium barkeri TaxID=1528 RepID=A0A1H3IN64_EUBBA|nr:phage portal protein [Eubacterium barkeri]SDY29273.1 Phage portal protein, SPP1 Gp6-like [Eubacterium barkeri]
MSEMWESGKCIDFKAPQVLGLSGIDQENLNELVDVWRMKLFRNRTKKQYYNQKNGLKDLGIAIPPALKNMECAMGWPAKAVDMLTVRSRFDGFVFPDSEDFGVNAILHANNFGVLYRQATTSELIHSCAFITVSKGGSGDPSVMLSSYDAETAAALWDNRRKKIKCGMTIVDVDTKTREPTRINLYTAGAVVEMVRNNAEIWEANYLYHKQGRPLMEPMVYRPTLDKPFGKSRISRAVMSITDSAIRTAVRTEISSEFFTSPQKYLMGADPELFANNSKWAAYIGNIFSVSKDEDGDVPAFGQLPQASMQPHMDYMRSLAAQFAGETSIPISSLGVIHDNPASAEAIYAAKEDLIIEAEGLNETNGMALRNIGLLVAAIAGNTTVDALPDDVKKIQPRFRNPAIPSVVSQSDAIIKQVSAIPWIAESQVALEELGYTESQITRLLSDKRKYESKKALESIRATLNDGDGNAEP